MDSRVRPTRQRGLGFHLGCALPVTLTDAYVYTPDIEIPFESRNENMGSSCEEVILDRVSEMSSPYPQF